MSTASSAAADPPDDDDQKRAVKPPELATGGGLDGYSIAAVNAHDATMTKYAEALRSSSRMFAFEKRSDVVSADDVRLAERQLLRAHRKRDEYVRDLALLLIGAALGYAGNVIIAQSYTFINAIVFLVPFASGLFLYGLSFGRD